MKRLLLVMLFLSAARTAEASCAPPTSQLVWSWPEKGATGVPTNAVIWAIGADVAVSIGGTPLAAAGTTGIERYRYDPGPLAPNAAIEVLFTIGTGATVKKVKLDFETGGGPNEAAPAAPVVTGHIEIGPTDVSSACLDIAWPQGCFDTYQDRVRLTLQTDAPALAFDSTEGSILWPGSCPPEVWVHTWDTAKCIDLKALSASGQASPVTTYCPNAETTAEGGKKSGGGGASGCATGGDRAAPWWLLLALPLLVRRRWTA